MSETLFDIEPKPAKFLKIPLMCSVYLPFKCEKCGCAIIPDCSRAMAECRMCDGKMRSIMWHEYVLELLNYNHTVPALKFSKLSEKIKREYERTLSYIETMGRKVHAGVVMDEFNKEMHDLVERFEEEEVWV